MDALVGRWKAVSLWGSVFSFAVVAGLLFGPVVESMFFPVLTNVRFKVVAIKPDRITVDWWGVRNRDTCELRKQGGISATVLHDNDWVLAVVSKSGDNNDLPLEAGTTRPAGWQRFARLDILPTGEAVRITLRHDCHPLWPTVTALPVINLPLER